MLSQLKLLKKTLLMMQSLPVAAVKGCFNAKRSQKLNFQIPSFVQMSASDRGGGTEAAAAVQSWGGQAEDGLRPLCYVRTRVTQFVICTRVYTSSPFRNTSQQQQQHTFRHHSSYFIGGQGPPY